MTDTATAAGDKRVIRSKQRVVEATYELLAEGGISGFSVEEVARRSGVAKTTIYRHWRTRSALLLDACSEMTVVGAPAPTTGTLRGDLTILAERIAADLDDASSPWPLALPSIIDAAERDPEVAEVQARLQAQLVEPFLQAIEDAKSRGELARDHDGSAIVAAIVGPLVYRRWFSREPLDSSFMSAVIAHTLG